MIPETYVLQLGNTIIPFTLQSKHRNTLGITVFPDGAVLVSAPQDASLEAINIRLRRRAAWILRTRRYFEAFRPRTPERRYVNGETHRFLGRQLRLLLRAEEKKRVQVAGSFLVVGGAGVLDHVTVQKRVASWYGRQARRVFGERLQACLADFVPEHLVAPELTVRRLTRRWGSMSRDGKHLVLNVRLVAASRSEIDYVITHELCHIVHPHHGRSFFELLERKMPDWEKRKMRLERALA